ncbi:MAG: helix-turn-helix domain-containing protein [Chloroflexota bacterium]|nr:helix-turn-helix domain-containing protein [Chloroflexota bacterium]
MRWDDLREAWEADAEFRAAYRSEYPFHEIADSVVELRKERDLTQAELADLAGTSQSVIARLESGRHAVRVDLLNRIADGLGLVWRPKFDSPEAAAAIHESDVASTSKVAGHPQRATNWAYACLPLQDMTSPMYTGTVSVQTLGVPAATVRLEAPAHVHLIAGSPVVEVDRASHTTRQPGLALAS